MTVSSSIPDWTREAPRRIWDPSRRLLASIRAWQRARGPLRRWAGLRHRFWSVITGVNIPPETEIGGGLLLMHPNGVVIHREAVIGPNCQIMQQVTIGVNLGRKGAPKIGGNVYIGPGARILGPLVIGDHAVIGTNAVVLSDVPEGATAVGVPARILDRKRQ